MPNRKLILFCFILIFGNRLSAQTSEVIENYIKTYKEIAISEMLRTGVPASIKLAQGIHETLAGTSSLVQKSNNHFGIKCKTNWTGPSVSHTDDAPNECFRKYEMPEESYRDHSDFLRNSTRYSSLFKLDPLDYEGWARGLKNAGYATNPRYPQIIIKLIETYHLQDYSLIALERKGSRTEEVNADMADAIVQEVPENSTEKIYPPVPDNYPLTPAPAVTTYPLGEFRLNSTRVVYVAAGESMLFVAEKYNIPLAKLFEFNELEPSETLLKGQLIFLQRKRKTGEADYHVVKAGETMADIAQLEAIRLESLLELNHLKNYMQPAAGEKLYLRKKAPASPRLVNDLTISTNSSPAPAR
ncbi:MAG: glucosaminidase domain-containing protein [Chitinophagaceae bacterium]